MVDNSICNNIKAAKYLKALFCMTFISFFTISCEPKKEEPIPVQIEFDKTLELKENTGEITYIISQPAAKYIVTPDMEPLPEGVISRTYYVLNEAGEAYKIGFNSDIKLLTKTEYSQINKAKLTVILNNNEVTQVTFNVTIIKYPDLNSNGKTENNEKLFNIKIKEEIPSTKINMLSPGWCCSVKTNGWRTINMDKSKNDDSKRVWSEDAVKQWFNDKSMTKSELQFLDNDKLILTLVF